MGDVYAERITLGKYCMCLDKRVKRKIEVWKLPCKEERKRDEVIGAKIHAELNKDFKLKDIKAFEDFLTTSRCQQAVNNIQHTVGAPEREVESASGNQI